MQFQTPTLSALIKAAWLGICLRTELFVLLSLLSGILSAILYMPSAEVITNLIEILDGQNDPETKTADAAAAIDEGASTLFFGHLMVTAVTTFLIIPWARACAPGALTPSAGGTKAFLRRGFRSFLHMVAATGMIVLLALVALPTVSIIGGALGGLGNAVVMTGVVLIVWASIALTGIANLAIAAEARDRRETLWTAWSRGRFFLTPITGALGFLLLSVGLANMIVSSLLAGLLPSGIAEVIGMVLSGTFIYAASALHVSALYLVPDFRDLRPL